MIEAILKNYIKVYEQGDLISLQEWLLNNYSKTQAEMYFKTIDIKCNGHSIEKIYKFLKDKYV
jgi:hypothetical protein